MPVFLFKANFANLFTVHFDGLRSILTEIQIPKDIAEKLYEKVGNLNESGIPAFRLIAGLLKAMPNRFDELALTVRVGLVSEEVDLAKGATAGLYHWLTTSVEIASQIQSPPDDLVREIGIMIATRRKVSLGPALQIAKWVFDEGSDAQKEAIRHLALQGLDYLSEELRYDREHDQDSDQDSIDVPFTAVAQCPTCLIDGQARVRRRSRCCPLVEDCQDGSFARSSICQRPHFGPPVGGCCHCK